MAKCWQKFYSPSLAREEYCKEGVSDLDTQFYDLNGQFKDARIFIIHGDSNAYSFLLALSVSQKILFMMSISFENDQVS